MKATAIRVGYGLVSSIVVAVIGLTSEARSQGVEVADIKITFARPFGAPPPFGGFLSHDALYPPDARGGPDPQGPLADLVAKKISAIRVTWFDPIHFKNDGEADSLLRTLLTSRTTDTYPWHIWSFGDGQPRLVATVEHPGGKQGRWVIWCPSPALYWAYQDGSGKWWWGAWREYPPTPRPTACSKPTPQSN